MFKNRIKINFIEYFHKEITLIFYIFCIVSILGNVLDVVPVFNSIFNSIILIININAIILSLLFLILFKKKFISLKTAIIFILYLNIFNLIISQYFDKNSSLYVYYLLRSMLFMALFISISTIILGYFHSIITTIITIVYYVIIMLITHNPFLESNIIIVLMAILSFSIAFNYFGNIIKDTVLKLYQSNIIVTQQHNELEKLNEELKEHRTKLIDQNEELRSITDLLKEKSDLILERNNELEILNKTKDKFFSIISHDLKGSIGSFMGVIELLIIKNSLFTEEKRQEILLNLFNHSTNLYQLLKNLLEWSRSQNDLIKPNKEICKVKELVSNACNVLYQNAVNKKITLSCFIPEDQEMYADKMMIDTVIRNFISNAIKFTKEKGEISIHSEVKNNLIYLTIKDNGIGIPEHIKVNIFKLTNKNSTMGTAGEIGTGLGLLLCNEFVKKNNGNIEFISTENEGTSFTLILPISEN